MPKRRGEIEDDLFATKKKAEIRPKVAEDAHDKTYDVLETKTQSTKNEDNSDLVIKHQNTNRESQEILETKTQSTKEPKAEKPIPAVQSERTIAKNPVLGTKTQNAKEPKDRIPAYVPVSLLQRLETAQLQIKVETGRRGHEVSLSRLVEHSLTMMLDDYDANGTQSDLFIKVITS